MGEPFVHVDRPWPLEEVEQEEPQNEEEAQRRQPFGPLGLKLIGSWEE